MSARLVIHAEIETHEDITEAMQLWVQVNAENPFNLIRFRDHILGMAHGLTKKTEKATSDQPIEGATTS